MSIIEQNRTECICLRPLMSIYETNTEEIQAHTPKEKHKANQRYDKFYYY